MLLIENQNDTGYVLFFSFFYYAINNAYLLYKHNCKLFDMPPKELLDFCADLVNLLICRSRYRKRPVVPQIPEMVFQVVAFVPSVELEKLAHREESVATAGCGQTSSSSHHLCLLFL